MPSQSGDDGPPVRPLRARARSPPASRGHGHLAVPRRRRDAVAPRRRPGVPHALRPPALETLFVLFAALTRSPSSRLVVSGWHYAIDGYAASSSRGSAFRERGGNRRVPSARVTSPPDADPPLHGQGRRRQDDRRRRDGPDARCAGPEDARHVRGRGALPRRPFDRDSRSRTSTTAARARRREPLDPGGGRHGGDRPALEGHLGLHHDAPRRDGRRGGPRRGARDLPGHGGGLRAPLREPVTRGRRRSTS